MKKINFTTTTFLIYSVVALAIGCASHSVFSQEKIISCEEKQEQLISHYEKELKVFMKRDRISWKTLNICKEELYQCNKDLVFISEQANYNLICSSNVCRLEDRPDKDK